MHTNCSPSQEMFPGPNCSSRRVLQLPRTSVDLISTQTLRSAAPRPPPPIRLQGLVPQPSLSPGILCPPPRAGPSHSFKLFLCHGSAQSGTPAGEVSSFLRNSEVRGLSLPPAEMDRPKPKVFPVGHCCPSLGMRALEAGSGRLSVPPSIR